MGRGRAKAKQTKVARALKYHSPDTDLAALQRELGGSTDAEGDDFEALEDEDEEDDEQSSDDGTWATRSR